MRLTRTDTDRRRPRDNTRAAALRTTLVPPAGRSIGQDWDAETVGSGHRDVSERGGECVIERRRRG